ncbi:MAG TPA: hypothetical protein VI094_05735 [Propionibacteriaceae bacterium]
MVTDFQERARRLRNAVEPVAGAAERSAVVRGAKGHGRMPIEVAES